MLTPVAAVLFARTTAAIALLVTLQFAVFVLLFITKLKSVHYRRHQHCCCYCVRPLHPLLLYYSKVEMMVAMVMIMVAMACLRIV